MSRDAAKIFDEIANTETDVVLNESPRWTDRCAENPFDWRIHVDKWYNR